MRSIRGIALTLCAFISVGFVATSAGASNDADFAKQWSLAKIGAVERAKRAQPYDFMFTYD